MLLIAAKNAFLFSILVVKLAKIGADNIENSSKYVSKDGTVKELRYLTDQCRQNPMIYQNPSTLWGCEELDDIWHNKPTYDLQLISDSGFWREVYGGKVGGKSIVYKHIRDTFQMDPPLIERHRQEALALLSVSNSKHVVGILGYCETEVVTAFLPLSLLKLVHPLIEEGVELMPLPLSLVLDLSIQATKGLDALHNSPFGTIVHGDLHIEQFLFDDEGVLRLNDLNYSTIMEYNIETNEPCPFIVSSPGGRWRPPEEYAYKWVNEKTDIYSLALVFHAILGRKYPVPKHMDIEIYRHQVINGMRPLLDPSWDRDYVELMRSMWSPSPFDRPSTKEILRRLERMIENEKKTNPDDVSKNVHQMCEDHFRRPKPMNQSQTCDRLKPIPRRTATN